MNRHALAQALLTMLFSVVTVSGQVTAVGYANRSFSPGLNLGSKPLFGEPDTVGELSGVPDGTVIFQITEEGWTENIKEDGAWLRPDDELKVGDGFFVLNPTDGPFTVTFTGEVLQGDLTNPIPAGISLQGNLFPMEGLLSRHLGLHLNRFDNVYLFKNGELDVYTFVPDWTWKPVEPVVAIAEGFMVNASQATNWVRRFFVTGSGRGTLHPMSLASPTAQLGTVNFANAAAGLDAPVTISGGSAVAGPDWKAQLLYRSGSDYVHLGEPVAFEVGALAGYFFGGRISVPNSAAGDRATFKVRVSYRGRTMGESAAVTVSLGGGIIPPANLSDLSAWQVPKPLELTITPENGGTILSWPAEYANATLETTTGFPANWEAFSGAKLQHGDVVNVSPSGMDERRFFRLRLR